MMRGNGNRQADGIHPAGPAIRIESTCLLACTYTLAIQLKSLKCLQCCINTLCLHFKASIVTINLNSADLTAAETVLGQKSFKHLCS